MTTRLPELLRGACLAPLPQGALVPITAFFAALGSGIILRTAYDLARPIPVGDERETGRHMLQWCLVMGLTILFWFGLKGLAGGSLVPPPDQLGGWLLFCVAAAGAAMALRSLARMQIKMWSPQASTTSIIPELDARLPVDDPDSVPPLPALDPVEPDRRLVSRSNIPGLLFGALMLSAAIYGWDTGSLCLLRLPQ